MKTRPRHTNPAYRNQCFFHCKWVASAPRNSRSWVEGVLNFMGIQKEWQQGSVVSGEVDILGATRQEALRKNNFGTRRIEKKGNRNPDMKNKWEKKIWNAKLRKSAALIPAQGIHGNSSVGVGKSLEAIDGGPDLPASGRNAAPRKKPKTSRVPQHGGPTQERN